MGCRPDLQAPQMWLQTLCVYALWPSGCRHCNNNNAYRKLLDEGCTPTIAALAQLQRSAARMAYIHITVFGMYSLKNSNLSIIILISMPTAVYNMGTASLQTLIHKCKHRHRLYCQKRSRQKFDRPAKRAVYHMPCSAHSGKGGQPSVFPLWASSC